MKRLVGMSAVLCMVCSCAQRVWIKDGATDQDFVSDSY